MKQITEDYVTYETAVLLKEKGFDELCFALYNPKEELIQCGVRLSNTQVGRVPGSYSAPTHQMALKWLREVHNIYIDILTYTTGKNIQFRWVGYDNGRLFSQEEGKTIYFEFYKKAVEAALKYTLENLI